MPMFIKSFLNQYFFISSTCLCIYSNSSYVDAYEFFTRFKSSNKRLDYRSLKILDAGTSLVEVVENCEKSLS